jgi:uncharacterized protein (DUF1684 family)
VKKIGLLSIIVFLFVGCSRLQENYILKIEQERQTKDSLFLIAAESPLSKDQIMEFEGLKYFPVDSKYKVKARLQVLDSLSIVQLLTSTDRLPEYRIYGYIYFDLEGKSHKLTAFKSEELQNDTLYSELLFLPFNDNNSSNLTYGGGRYLDFSIPITDTFVLDFNRAYNPYCAYNHKWSCVIPPRENSLQIAINAGEKNYKDY